MAIGTQGALKTRIALELARPDILSNDGRIADAITDAITMYQKERFRFSDINPASPPTFTTIASQPFYSATDSNLDVAILNQFFISYLVYTLGTQSFYVRRVTPLDITLANQNNNVQGPPEAFAYEGETIMLTPVPDQAYVMTLDCHLLVPAPASDSATGNRWMTDGEMLIRSRVKFEIATHITRNLAMAAAMSPDPPAPGALMGATYRAYKALKGEANRLTGRGRVAPMPW